MYIQKCSILFEAIQQNLAMQEPSSFRTCSYRLEFTIHPFMEGDLHPAFADVFENGRRKIEYFRSKLQFRIMAVFIAGF